MSRSAWAYILIVITTGALLAGRALFDFPPPTSQLLPFVVLTVLATLAQTFNAKAPTHQLYHTTHVIAFAALLLLDSSLFVLLIVISHVAEWVKERLVESEHLAQWYLQPFNMSFHIIGGAAASAWIGLAGGASDASLGYSPTMIVTTITAAVIYLIINHALVGGALVIARGVSFRESGILNIENMVTDLVLLVLGYTLAVLWKLSPWLLVPALSPLILIYRALMVPQLKQVAQIDGKTGLLNAHSFMELFKAEFERCRSQRIPLSVIMADLDLLRNINNTYGHLAGDAVLAGVGAIIRRTIRDSDLAGRFGGEEFAIVLPGVDHAQTQLIAERLRLSVEEAGFESGSQPEPIRATMSLGVSCFPEDATELKELIHEADIAVYQAKLQGRNRVVFSTHVPHSFSLSEEGLAAADRVDNPYQATFIPRPSELRPDSPTESTVAEPQPSRSVTRLRLRDWLFVGGVSATALLVALVGARFDSPGAPQAILLLALLALVTELLQVDLYDNGSVSVSMTFVFAAALITGVPGLALVSAAIVVADYVRRRPPLYRSLFNWSVHLLAGLVPLLTLRALDMPLTHATLPILVLPVMIAAVGYFLIETGLIATAVGFSQKMSVSRVWQVHYQWLTGYWVVLGVLGLFLVVAYNENGLAGIITVVLPIFMMRFSQQQYIQRTNNSAHELRRLNRELNRANREILGASQSIRELNDGLFVTLAKIIDARDPYVSGHAAKVSEYATKIARELGLPAEQVELIRQSGFLHDIGKLGIPERILHKPSRLSREEYDFVKTHAPLGAEILETARGLGHLARFIRHHHERWNGSGYPDKLRRGEIPLEARILAVSDAVEAMASDRPYHSAMSVDEIVDELKRCSGTQFDPDVVDAFLAVLRREGRGLVVNSAADLDRSPLRNGVGDLESL